ncbi:c-type cytochrome domain-containing protein [Algoriphagus sp. CAU 1675]|uniref:c-type cytochrome domain-containing protein n=1 Tax=Algoriphagus sp. CAU 1675 TaxID=3032597 RepID=UPI0023DB4574|nr:c-type cytochrome domain-containing protein [Algoriphagus sp. CAU 1675]MDF2159329.1 FN3 associated domain-containing protein [Algoriphagus sp. CAU 1675]
MKKPSLQGILENLIFVWLGLGLILSIPSNSVFFPDWLQVLGRAHPLILHFPIVLLLMGFLLFWMPQKSELKKITELVILIGINFAGLTVLAGLILAREDYEGSEILWHQWAGIIVFLGSVLLYFFRKKSPTFNKAFGVILALGLVATGHWGANLTHGENFLLAPLKPDDLPKPSLSEAEVFRDMVQPILEAKCQSCHREGKVKGELRMDHLEGIQKGGKSGPFVVAGDLENSLMTQRISLPTEDKKHMPPKNKSQLSDEELSILKEWVRAGAAFDQKVTEIDSTSPLFQIATLQFSEEKTYSFSPVSQELVQSLNNYYRSVKPIHPESPALEVSYFGISAFDPTSLDDLKMIKEQLVHLNLNKMPLEGVDLSFLNDFPNLERLKLNFTGLSSGQIQQLEGLKNLRQLSLAGNSINQDGISILENLGDLSHLYLWQTGLDELQKERLRKSLKSTQIDFGFEGTGIVYELNPPKISQNKSLFSDSLEITLSHPIQSVQIRYTLDESEPDSIQSPVYSVPIWVKNSGKLKARVFAQGWKGSPTQSTVFLKSGIIPELYELKSDPNPRYKAQGSKTLFDQVKGKNNHTSGEWLGFQDSPLDLEFSIGNNQKIGSLELSLLYHEGAYIFPPSKVEILYWENGKWNSMIQKSPEPSDKIRDPRSELLKFNLGDKAFEKLKVRVFPIASLPSWHPGSGAKGWVFIDEILLN